VGSENQGGGPTDSVGGPWKHRSLSSGPDVITASFVRFRRCSPSPKRHSFQWPRVDPLSRAAENDLASKAPIPSEPPAITAQGPYFFEERETEDLAFIISHPAARRKTGRSRRVCHECIR